MNDSGLTVGLLEQMRQDFEAIDKKKKEIDVLEDEISLIKHKYSSRFRLLSKEGHLDNIYLINDKELHILYSGSCLGENWHDHIIIPIQFFLEPDETMAVYNYKVYLLNLQEEKKKRENDKQKQQELSQLAALKLKYEVNK